MKPRHALPLLLLCWGAIATGAEVTCPELAAAVQVGTCPSEEDLRYTFKGYCSDNARMYDGEKQVCTDYSLYRELKNVSLWETRDGLFAGYVSCEPGRADLAAARPSKLAVGKQGTVTRIACSYDTGVVFAYRTKAKCAAAVADCTAAAAVCRAQCE